MARLMRRRHAVLRNWPVKLAVMAVAMAVMGVAVYGGVTIATDDFTDVPNGAFYHDDVGWAKDRLITGGCGGGKYCPNQDVTRGQMATFLEAAGDVFTPTFVDATNFCFLCGPQNLDLNADPVVCQSSTYTTPGYEQQAIMMARTSITAANGDVSYFAYGVYSSNGGASWSNFSPGWSVESEATAAGQDINLPYMGHANLSPNTDYVFGVQLVDDEGDDGGAGDEATDHWCAYTTEILNRQP
jgi:hypothetical protein